jgi:S1-C subfamily serine protease
MSSRFPEESIRMSRILATIGGCLICCTLNAQSDPSFRKAGEMKPMNLPMAIEYIRPAVVQILIKVQPPPDQAGGIQLPARPLQAPLGTGFLASAEGYVVTARHVVEDFRNIQAAGQKTLMVGLALPNLENFKSGGATMSIRGSFVLVGCEVIDEDSRHDLALLRLARNPFRGEIRPLNMGGATPIDIPHDVARFSSTRPQDGESIAVSGYPLNVAVLVTTSGNVASSWPADVQELPVPGAPAWFTKTDIADSYLADMHVNPGNSGGPVYSVTYGTVIGVCVGFDLAPVLYTDGGHEPATAGNRPISYNSGLSVVVPIHYVVDLLKKHALKWEERAD